MIAALIHEKFCDPVEVCVGDGDGVGVEVVLGLGDGVGD